MIRDDTGPDEELLRKLSTLGRDDPIPETFTDRVLVDLGRRGLVRPPAAGVIAARWWAVAAAAVVIFALGLSVGSAILAPRLTPAPSLTPSSATADPPGAEVNVPRVGQSEVWF